MTQKNEGKPPAEYQVPKPEPEKLGLVGPVGECRTFSPEEIVKRLGRSREEFVGERGDSSRNVEVLFAMLPVSENEAFFACERFGKASEHSDLVIKHPTGQVEGKQVVRGDLLGEIKDTGGESYIKLKMPDIPSREYRTARGIAKEVEAEAAINDLILSARLLCRGGIPENKRLELEAGSFEADMLEAVHPSRQPIKEIDTLGKLARLPLIKT